MTTHLRIFVASPGDVPDERDAVGRVVEELSRIFSNTYDISIETVRWETHAYPDVGDDAQSVINKQIGEYDVFVGVMWRRFGTPTGRADSGTEEEFNRAFDLHQKFQRPTIMFYFRESSFYPDLKELPQIRKVLLFQKKLSKGGVLYWTYDGTEAFERYVREHLAKHILKIVAPPKVIAKKATKKQKDDDQRFRVFIAEFGRTPMERQRLYRVYDTLKADDFAVYMRSRDALPGDDTLVEEKAYETADIVLMLYTGQASHDSLLTITSLRPVIILADKRQVPDSVVSRYPVYDVSTDEGQRSLLKFMRNLRGHRQTTR